jgi:hypothetical protein
MKARFVSPLGEFEVEAPEIKEVFRQLATVQEVFGAETNCGVCNSENIRLQYREVDDYKFYELACMSQGCRARFAFGQAKKGGALFPKRKDEDGNWLKNGGWEKYTPPGAATEPPPQRAQPPQRNAQAPSQPSGTDAQTQERYNKLAKAWGIEKAPVRFADLVQMCRDYFASLTAPSTEGAQEFDKLYRRYMYEHPEDSLHPSNIKSFMTEVWESHQTLKNAGVPY